MNFKALIAATKSKEDLVAVCFGWLIGYLLAVGFSASTSIPAHLIAGVTALGILNLKQVLCSSRPRRRVGKKGHRATVRRNCAVKAKASAKAKCLEFPSALKKSN